MIKQGLRWGLLGSALEALAGTRRWKNRRRTGPNSANSRSCVKCSISLWLSFQPGSTKGNGLFWRKPGPKNARSFLMQWPFLMLARRAEQGTRTRRRAEQGRARPNSDRPRPKRSRTFQRRRPICRATKRACVHFAAAARRDFPTLAGKCCDVPQPEQRCGGSTRALGGEALGSGANAGGTTGRQVRLGATACGTSSALCSSAPLPLLPRDDYQI